MLIVSCNSKEPKVITEGTIEYEISYPEYKKKDNSFYNLLPKKMITSFKHNCYKNEFIFNNESFKLQVISLCDEKKTKLSICAGNSKKYTELDSNSIYQLLNEFPKYTPIFQPLDSIVYLGKPCVRYKVNCSKKDTSYPIVTTKYISIHNVNWCTPFNQIEDVMLDYQLSQYDLEMKLKAIKINNVSVDDETFILTEDYEYQEIKQYLDQIEFYFMIFK